MLAWALPLLAATQALGQSAGSPNARGFVTTSAPSYTDNTYANLSLDANGNLRVVTTGSSGLSVTDSATWTAAASAFTPTGGEYNPLATSLAAGQQGTVALTANRALLGNPVDSIGREIGASLPGRQPVPVVVAALPQFPVPVPRLQRPGSPVVSVGQGTQIGAPTATAMNIGGLTTQNLLRAFIFCDRSVKIDTTASGNTELVPALAGKSIYVCGLDYVSTSALSVKTVYGTGTACGTGQVDLEGAQAVAANSGKVIPVSASPKWITPVSQALCINLSAGTQVSGSVTYTQF